MDFVSGLRAALQDVLVPELKAIQVRLEHLEQRFEGLERRLEAHAVENDQRFDSLTREMNQRFEANAQEHSAMLQTMASMNGKLDVLITLVGDIKELSAVRARVEVLEREVAQLRGSR